jgi:integrase
MALFGAHETASREPDYEKEALETLKRCAARAFHCPIDTLTEEQLVHPHVEYLFYLEVPLDRKQVYTAARKICTEIDDSQQYFKGKYSKVRHPLLEDHARRHATTKAHYYNIIRNGMRMLEYLCELPYFRLQRPFDFRVGLIRREHILRYRAALLARVQRGEVTSGSERKSLGFAIRWLKELQDQGYINQNVDFTGLTIPKSEHRQRKLVNLTLLEAEVNKYMSRPEYAGLVLYVLLELATGARPGELTKLTVRHLDPSSQSIWLQSKNGAGRRIPLLTFAWTALQQYVASRNYKEDECILRNTQGGPLTYASICQALKSMECTIDGLVAFRHTFATGCLRSGVASHITSHVLGHKDPASLQTYQRADGDFVRKEVDRAYNEWGANHVDESGEVRLDY